MKKQPKIENLERREYVRIDHTSPLQIKELKSGKTHNARMFNYSKQGLYFESDSSLQAGENIRIAIEDSPFSIKAGVLEYYIAKIKWRKKCQDSYFDFGYGVKLLPPIGNDKKRSDNINSRTSLEQNSIRSYRKSITFKDRRKTYEGVIEDISSSGVFLSCQDTPEIGQILSFVLPLKSGIKARIEGQVIWADDNGMGVVFLSDH
jgi:hypothetical protein